MKRPVAALCLVVLTLSLANCSSRLNPFNWFGPSTPSVETAPPESTDGRMLIQQVTALSTERAPTGIIVRATGLPPTQGWWKAGLVAENSGVPVDGVMSYRFVVYMPETPQQAVTVQSREITVAAHISNTVAADVHKIVVKGSANSRETSR